MGEEKTEKKEDKQQKKKDSPIHKDHRQRMKERFLREQDNLQDHEILELLLYYAIPQKKTNPLAHTLLEKFGSLPGVFEAPLQELYAIKGIGEHVAILLHLMPNLLRRYYSQIDERGTVLLTSTEDVCQFLKPQFLGRTTEWFYLICLNQKSEITFSGFLFEGSINAIIVRIRDIISICLNNNASSVILAHNHPHSLALPSPEDVYTTEKVFHALNTISVKLRDHIIVCGLEAISMRDSGHFKCFKDR